jgi:hypothetical protein
MADFIWKGKHLATVGDLLDGMGSVKTAEEAQEFTAAYLAVNEYAAANLGYIAGCCDNETRRRYHEWFQVDHPVFGRSY